MSGDTVHVVAQWNDDGETWWMSECAPDEYDDDSRAFEGDVPRHLWEIRKQAIDAWSMVDREITHVLELAEGRRAAACDKWSGYESDRTPDLWWIKISASDGTEWPIRDARLGFYQNSEGEAIAYLADLPDEFWLAAEGPHPIRVTKDRLSIEHLPGCGPTSYECHRCGWPRDEHPGPAVSS